MQTTGQLWKVLPCYIPYSEGLNVSEKVSITCTDTQNVPSYLGVGNKIARVTIPDGARVVRENDRMKTDQIILSDIMDLKDWHMWENYTFCLEAVKKSGFAVYYLKGFTTEQYTRLCLEAIKHYRHVLTIVKPESAGDKYVEICLEAVKSNGNAIHYVKKDLVGDRYNELCSEAVKQNPYASCYV